MRHDIYGNLQFEKDLLDSKEVMSLVKNDDFAQKLYASLCNNGWVKNNNEYFVSWRSAGGLVAFLRDIKLGTAEDYLDFYCSGGEGTVFPEVERVLNNLGWSLIPKTKDSDVS